MTDSHCHLNFEAFSTDVEEVIKRAQDAGVKRIVNVGTKLDSSKWAVDLAHQYQGLLAIVGIHPHHADKVEKGWEKELKNLAQDTKVIAIGEIGLDYFSYKSNGVVDPKVQREVFETQIALAHSLHLPLQIHTRLAWDDVYEVLSSHRNILQSVPGMFHCFSGDIAFLKKVLDLGFYVGFDGNVTYPGVPKGETTAIKELALYAPADRILIETDSPYLTPVPMRGLRNEPKHAIIVAEYLAKLKQIPYQDFCYQLENNFETCFALKGEQ